MYITRKSFPSFGGRQEAITGGAGALAGQSIDFGAIHAEPRGALLYRADIRLFNGTILTKVRLPGPWYARSGHFSGFKFPFRRGQFVVIAYRNGRADSPIVVAVLPFLATSENRDNLGASKKLPGDHQYDPAETAVGHESGFKSVWAKDELKIIDKDGERVWSLDLSDKLLDVKLEKFRFESPSVKVAAEMGDLSIEVGGTTLKLFRHTHPTIFGPTGPPIYGG